MTTAYHPDEQSVGQTAARTVAAGLAGPGVSVTEQTDGFAAFETTAPEPVLVPTEHGLFAMRAWPGAGGVEHLSATAVHPDGTPRTGPGAPLVRLHSECLTGEAFGSLKCECGPQLDAALDTIAAESQRLINETYPGFVQGFMPSLARPDVDKLEHLRAAIVVGQEPMAASSRSTFGTATDITGLVRVLFSRAASPRAP